MATETHERESQNGRADGQGNGQARPQGPGSLDALLTEAARGPVRSWWPGMSGAKLAAKLALRPDLTARRGTELAAELARVAVGRSETAPPKGDRRFKDPAWMGNPAFRRLMQAYLAVGRTSEKLICDADLDWRGERRVRFAAENVLDAVAPSNLPVTNPAAIKATLDTGGRNFAQGARNLARDMAKPPRIPAMVDTSAFKVGEDLAITPGSVVLRTPVFELIQYEPRTPRVRECPLLVTPPMINKFYVTDLAPGRSMVEHALDQGQAVFTISWRNPDERDAVWGLGAYVKAVSEALEAIDRITEADAVHVLGLCAGGIVATCAMAHLAAMGDLDRIAALTLGVTVLDNV